jgi:hypothetical protein
MGRHTQQPVERKFVCTFCKEGNCNQCIDVARALLSMSLICDCTAEGHDGEPNRQQILDPETGAVHAPGLVVTQEGEVIKR